MSLLPHYLEKRLHRLAADKNFSQLIQNSLTLLTSNTIVSILQFLQVIVLARFLSPEGYGIFTLVTTFVLMVNQFIDVRVSEMAVRFGAEYLAKQDFPRVAAIIKLSYFIDASTGIIAYLLVMASATWAAQTLLHNGDLAGLSQLYATVLLISTVDNTSNAVLRIYNRFKWISVYSSVMTLLELVMVTLAAVMGAGVQGVLVALILKDGISAFVNTSLSLKVVSQQLGLRQVFTTPVHLIQDRYKEIGRLLWHTNLIAYFRMVNTKVDILILGFFRPPAEVGLYKVARQLATLIGRVSDPFFTAILPDLSRLWYEKRIVEYKHLIRRSSLLLAILLIPGAFVMMALSRFIIVVISGEAFLTAVSLVNVCIWAFVIGGIFFWTWPAALSMQKPHYGTTIGFISVPIQLILALILVPSFGGLGSSWVLVINYIFVQLSMTWLIVRQIQQKQAVLTESPTPHHPVC